MRLNTMHNLHHYSTLMNKIREAIAASEYGTFREEFRRRWRPRQAHDADSASVARPGSE